MAARFSEVAQWPDNVGLNSQQKLNSNYPIGKGLKILRHSILDLSSQF